jgi:hypothetical protein
MNRQMEDVRTALQLLVNYLESKPSLYDGDVDGAFSRVMQNAYDALRVFEHGLYHVTYIEVGTLKQKHTQMVANNVPHAIYLSSIKIGDKWESAVDGYLIERWGGE